MHCNENMQHATFSFSVEEERDGAFPPLLAEKDHKQCLLKQSSGSRRSREPAH